MGYWAFGDIICQLWLSTDVLLCTASILNLCLISLDRYWSITRPIDYVRARTPRRAALMISVVWTLSMLISLPPLVGWKRPQPTHLGFPHLGFPISGSLCASSAPNSATFSTRPSALSTFLCSSWCSSISRFIWRRVPGPDAISSQRNWKE